MRHVISRCVDALLPRGGGADGGGVGGGGEDEDGADGWYVDLLVFFFTACRGLPRRRPMGSRCKNVSLAPRYVDGTFGRGGHSRALLARLSARGRVLAMDMDAEVRHRTGKQVAGRRPRRPLLAHRRRAVVRRGRRRHRRRQRHRLGCRRAAARESAHESASTRAGGARRARRARHLEQPPAVAPPPYGGAC